MDGDAAAWVRRANARTIGKVEFRQVLLEIGQGRMARRLSIRTLRYDDGGRATTVTCVVRPRPLRNINYSTVEERGHLEPFDIRLYLPYVGGSLRPVAPRRRCEALLGSDFTYDDLRTWLCEEGHVYERLADDAEGNVVLRGRCLDPRAYRVFGGDPFEVVVEPASGLVAGTRTLTGDGRTVRRVYRADPVIVVDGVLVPERMRMTDLRRDRSTTIHLERAWYDRHDIDPGIFEPGRRAETADYLDEL